MCVSNALANIFKLWNHFIGMRSVIKAHKQPTQKDVKACLLKHMVTKQSLLLLNEIFLPVNTA